VRPKRRLCVAYRQLCAAAFVMFGLSVACGGGTASSAVDPNVDDPSPPSADDPPPSSSDDSPPSSDDSPPSNPDTPPGNTDSPGGGGGRIQQLCESACEVLERLSDCPDGMEIDPMSREVCDNGGCSMAVDPGEQVECLDQLEGLFGCIARLPDVCMPSQEQAMVCLGEVEAFSDCAEDVDPDPVDPDPVDPDPQTCMAPSCNCGGEACAECFCENADLGADALEFCADVCPMP
jgi:hypothetical protein